MKDCGAAIFNTAGCLSTAALASFCQCLINLLDNSLIVSKRKLKMLSTTIKKGGDLFIYLSEIIQLLLYALIKSQSESGSQASLYQTSNTDKVSF